MLSVHKHSVLVLMILSAILLPALMGVVLSAPQGREIYNGEEEAKLEKLHHEPNKRQPTTVEQPLKIEQELAPPKEISEKPTQHAKICGYEDTSEWQHHIQIRETKDTLKGEASEGHLHICQSYQDHKVKIRQTQVDGTETESESELPQDDLVASLIRQRNDFIAAAGIAEAPRPVQAMRVNMNSGL